MHSTLSVLFSLLIIELLVLVFGVLLSLSNLLSLVAPD